MVDDPTIITIKHWSRILDAELYATSSSVDWAILLRRTYGVAALRCPTCAARMRVLATVTEPSVVKKILSHLGLPTQHERLDVGDHRGRKKILSHLGLPTQPLPRARVRDPTGQQSFDFAAA